MNIKKSKTVDYIIFIILAILPFVFSVISICTGIFDISVTDIINSLKANIFGGARTDAAIEYILWQNRLPRIILACFVGAGLSVAGCTFQSLFNNPLATPDTLGVASGSAFGAAFAILLGFGIAGIQLFSFVFGLAAVFLTIFAAKQKSGNNLNGMVLSGIMIGSLFSALITLIKYTADTESQLPAIEYWLMGSFSSASYDVILFGVPPIVICAIVLLLLRWRLNSLFLTDEEALSSGVNIKLLRIVVIICATVITASCVSMSGQVGWVGLIVPHICRMKFGNNHTRTLPACVLAGSSLMILVDTISRSVTEVGIPLSVLTAIIGAPFFIILMKKDSGRIS